MLKERIAGVWSLKRWATLVNGEVAGYPLGEEATGFIAYHAEGFMSVEISAANRVRLPVDDPFSGDSDLLAFDARGYLSYCGPFSVLSESEVVHHVKLCSFENWVGSDQHRNARLDGDLLELSTAPRLFQGKEGIAILTWRRVRGF